MTDPGPLPRPGALEASVTPGVVVLWTVGLLVAGAIVGSLLASVVAAISGSTTGAGTTLVGEFGLWSGMTGAAVVVSRRFGTRSLSDDFGFRIGWKDIWPGLVALVAGLIVTNVIGLAFSGTRFAGSNTQLITGQKHDGLGFAIITVVVAIGAPFFEELFFRGVLRVALTARLGSHGAVWGQAILFGLAHYQPGSGLGNVSIMVIVGSLGVVLGYAARATKRLGPGMIAHGLYNLVQVLLILN